MGKTRLLVEWTSRHRGAYFVADQSSGEIQRDYLSRALTEVLPGFSEVRFPGWEPLLSQLARQAKAQNWKGPVVFDEFPYLVEQDRTLPSVLQRWVDHDAKQVGLSCVIAGSSQRMMQGLVLDREAPLYGRAKELLELRPLLPSFLRGAFGGDAADQIDRYAAWGGIPRYWELAVDTSGGVESQIDRLVLNPLGPLHREPDRLLLEEIPPAMELRPILDAIGAGAHRVSEIAGRIGMPATSLSRPLSRLTEMGLVAREVPFGELEKRSKRSLYRIADPFIRLWFRVVAPNRGLLATTSREGRLAVLRQHWPRLVAAAFEELVRKQLPQLARNTRLGRMGPFGNVGRFWKGNDPEWDLVADTVDGKHRLLGEVKWSERPFSAKALRALEHDLLRRPSPAVRGTAPDSEIRALVVPALRAGVRRASLGVPVITAEDLL